MHSCGQIKDNITCSVQTLLVALHTMPLLRGGKHIVQQIIIDPIKPSTLGHGRKYFLRFVLVRFVLVVAG
jgi:hypothetical protein